ncbi:MAG: DUF2188 domain-containing protein [Pseudomonadota bacterium]
MTRLTRAGNEAGTQIGLLEDSMDQGAAMAALQDVHHVLPNGHGGWCIKRDGCDEPLLNTSTKIQAIRIGSEMNRRQGISVVVHEPQRLVSRLDGNVGIPFPFPFAVLEATEKV